MTPDANTEEFERLTAEEKRTLDALKNHDAQNDCQTERALKEVIAKFDHGRVPHKYSKPDAPPDRLPE